MLAELGRGQGEAAVPFDRAGQPPGRSLYRRAAVAGIEDESFDVPGEVDHAVAGHGEHDDFSYVPKEIYGESFACDCLQCTEEFIKEHDLVDSATLKAWREDAARQVDEAFITAQKEPIPNGENEDWCAISTRDLVDNPETE